MKESQINESLQELGLNPKESSIYLALLQSGQVGATRLGSLTGINRITTYGILESLKQKGFITTTKKEKKTEFSAIEPKKIQNIILQKQMTLNTILPDLESLSKVQKTKSSVKLYEGGKAVYELMIEIFGSGKEICSFGNMDIPEQEYEFDTSNLRKLRFSTNTKVRGIGNKLPSENTEKKIWKNLTEARVLKELEKLTTWTYIWEGKVANVSYKNGLRGELIEDEEFANTMIFLWEKLWKKSKV
jgi:HTH-type transcriptional regulator, sugar sensing transcriptional regulator